MGFSTTSGADWDSWSPLGSADQRCFDGHRVWKELSEADRVRRQQIKENAEIEGPDGRIYLSARWPFAIEEIVLGLHEFGKLGPKSFRSQWRVVQDVEALHLHSPDVSLAFALMEVGIAGLDLQDLDYARIRPCQ